MKEDPSNNKMKGLDQKKLVMELLPTQGLGESVKASLGNDCEKDRPDSSSDVNSGKFDETNGHRGFTSKEATKVLQHDLQSLLSRFQLFLC